MWKIGIALGWVPKTADRDQTYEHLNRRVPADIKYELHVLLVEHGKVRLHAGLMTVTCRLHHVLLVEHGRVGATQGGVAGRIAKRSCVTGKAVLLVHDRSRTPNTRVRTMPAPALASRCTRTTCRRCARRSGVRKPRSASTESRWRALGEAGCVR